MDSVSVSPKEKKHQPEEHLPEQAVLETDPAPPVHGGAQRSDAVCTQERTSLKSRCWRPTQHRLFTTVVRWVTEHEPWFLGVALPPLWLPGAVPALVPLSFALLAALLLCRWIVNRRWIVADAGSSPTPSP